MTELPPKSEGTPVSRRNLEIVRRLDPDGLLPKADLIISPTRLETPTRDVQGPSVFPTDGSREVYAYLFKGDVNVGLCRLERSNFYSTFTTEWVAVHEDYRRQGYAKQLHLSLLQALPQYYELRSDRRALNPAIGIIWRWIEDTGLAEKAEIIEEDYYELRYVTQLRKLSLRLNNP